MRPELILLCVGMMIVTYIPRALPAVIVDRLQFGPRVEKFLTLIPYTAMAAMIFPAIFSVDAARPEIGIVGGLVAAALAWKKLPLIGCMVAAIAADFILYLF